MMIIFFVKAAGQSLFFPIIMYIYHFDTLSIRPNLSSAWFPKKITFPSYKKLFSISNSHIRKSFEPSNFLEVSRICLGIFSSKIN